MKNIFEIVKSAVTPRQAAEAYGLTAHRNDMARCPFHDDKTPKMWCDENNMTLFKQRSFSECLIANERRYNLEYCNNVTNAAGRRVRGSWASRRW